MHNQIVNLPSSEVRLCDSCGEKAVRMKFADQKFCYGNGEQAVELSAHVPVWTCQSCGDQYTDELAEQIRHAVVCKHLNRLAPKEIIDLRKSYDATQSQWADLTGFGIASVKRWEAGNMIQNESADKFMRLLREPRNYETLEIFSRQADEHEVQKFKFRTALSPAAVSNAKTFELRPTTRELETA